jgi:WD40 repeat protein
MTRLILRGGIIGMLLSVVLAVGVIIAAPGTPVLLFWSDRDGDGDLYLLDVRTAALFNLTRTTTNEDLPRLSPTGDRITFTANGQGKQAVFVIDIDGTDRRQITNLTEWSGLAQWGPGPDQLTFIHEPPMGTQNITVRGVDDDAVFGDMIANGIDTVLIGWSPDREHFAYISGLGRDRVFYIITAEGEAVASFPFGSGGYTSAHWLPADAGLLLTRPDQAQAERVNPHTGETTASNTLAGRLTPNPVDSRVYVLDFFMGQTGDRRIYDLESGESQPLPPDLILMSVAWSPDGQYLAGISQEPAVYVLDSYTLAVLWQVPLGPISQFTRFEDLAWLP